MPTLTKNTAINPTEFLNRVKEVCNSLLPADANSYTSNSSSLPQFIKSDYLSNRASLLSDIQYIITTYGNNYIKNNKNLIDDRVFDLLREVFKEMSRCRKIYYYNVGAVSPGTQSAPIDIANGLGLSGNAGTWTYFKSSFGFDNTGRHVKPTKPNNANKDESGFETIPSNDWNYNTHLTADNTPRVSTLHINNLIQALETVETQFGNFSTNWSGKNNTTSWWDGNPNNQNNVSNKIFWCRYWCHSNCHSNCHGSRSRR